VKASHGSISHGKSLEGVNDPQPVWNSMDKTRTFTKKILFLIVPFALSAYGISSLVGASANHDPLMSSSLPVNTSTPTPFLPLQPTGIGQVTLEATVAPASTDMPVPTIGDPWGDFPGPIMQSAIAISPPVPPIDFPSYVVNVLLLGSDEAPDRQGHRTDTMMILSLNPQTGRVVLISIPRDLFVYIPGLRVDRINAGDVFGGAEMVTQSILYNFGIEIDYWVRVNFVGFVASVDHLGGIDVQVGQYLYDECGGIYYEYYPGTYHMDGRTALCYVRMRKTTSDFDRIRRQQEVLKSIFEKVLSLDGLTKFPQLYDDFSKWVEGNIGLSDLIPLIPLASELASGEATFKGVSIAGDMVTQWIMPLSGADVLLPERDRIQEMLHTIFTD
jgi:LCP family protein required for cell wall assembly